MSDETVLRQIGQLREKIKKQQELTLLSIRSKKQKEAQQQKARREVQQKNNMFNESLLELINMQLDLLVQSENISKRNPYFKVQNWKDIKTNFEKIQQQLINKFNYQCCKKCQNCFHNCKCQNCFRNCQCQNCFRDCQCQNCFYNSSCCNFKNLCQNIFCQVDCIKYGSYRIMKHSPCLVQVVLGFVCVCWPCVIWQQLIDCTSGHCCRCCRCDQFCLCCFRTCCGCQCCPRRCCSCQCCPRRCDCQCCPQRCGCQYQCNWYSCACSDCCFSQNIAIFKKLQNLYKRYVDLIK